MAFNLFAVCFRKKSLNRLPDNSFNEASKKFMPNRKMATPANVFHISKERNIRKEKLVQITLVGSKLNINYLKTFAMLKSVL